LSRFWNRAERIIEAEPSTEADLQPIDEWLLSKLQTTVRSTTEALEGFETRTASQAAFYGFEESLRWYRRRTDLGRPGARYTQREVLRTRLALLAPFVPFIANELHERLTGEPASQWPTVDETLESAEMEARETLVRDLTDDVNDIIDVVGRDPETIRLYIAADWKRSVLDQVIETGPDVGAVMGQVMSNPKLREKGNMVNQLVQELVGVVRERDDETLGTLQSLDELAVYKAATEFLAREFDADIQVYAEDDPDAVDPDGTAGNAQPLRPAIHIV
jgi:leucyl-tRNA synthetase